MAERARPWIIAHRGASFDAPENTIEAFRIAAELGADGVELDVRRTTDDRLVVHHNPRLADDAEPIVDISFDDLRRTAPHVPTLREVLEACPDIWLDIEIKNSPMDPDWDPGDRVVRMVLDLLADHPSRHRPMLTSFNPATVAVAASAGARTGLLLARGTTPSAVADAAPHEIVLPHVDTLASGDVAAVIAASDRPVAVWTVDDPALMRMLADAGATGIITNRPDVARSALDEDHSG